MSETIYAVILEGYGLNPKATEWLLEDLEEHNANLLENWIGSEKEFAKTYLKLTTETHPRLGVTVSRLKH